MKATETMSLVEKDYAESVRVAITDRLYYMLHRDRLSPNAMTIKMRVTFDDSSDTNCSDSLNKYVIKSLNLNYCIFNLLIQFRF